MLVEKKTEMLAEMTVDSKADAKDHLMAALKVVTLVYWMVDPKGTMTAEMTAAM
jgi:hypothetical protein